MLLLRQAHQSGAVWSILPFLLVKKAKQRLLQGRALYPIERMDAVTGRLFGDREHILYANGRSILKMIRRA